MVNSRIPGFYGWPLAERRRVLKELTGLTDLTALDPEALELSLADKLIENVVGVLGIPLGLGLNFRMNGTDYLVPLAVEEPSVVAAFSHASKLVRMGGGFTAETDPPHMIGQLQLSPRNEQEARDVERKLHAASSRISHAAKAAAKTMEKRGGGYQHHTVRYVPDPRGHPPMIVIHVVIHVADAMGANLVNHVAETLTPLVEQVAGIPVGLKILSNLSDLRLARARARIPIHALGGPQRAESIAEADRFAYIDPYRATTHNKGFMNGVDAVALATGNDWRAIEAGCHAYAARDGQYRSLTQWKVEDDHLVGETEVPMAVGVVGGITRSHPTIALAHQILGIPDAQTLAALFAASGLAQNLAAIKALSSEGIQRGHMSLHARQLAIAAGAQLDEVEAVVNKTLESGPISARRIEEVLNQHRHERNPA